MPDPHMQTDVEMMKTAAGTAESTAEFLDGMVRGLMTNLEPMMVDFVGAAGTKFQTAQEVILGAGGSGGSKAMVGQLPILVGALRSLADKLGVAGTNYAMAGEQMDDVIDTVVSESSANESDLQRIMAGGGAGQGHYA